jgi:hypothetical protein
MCPRSLRSGKGAASDPLATAEVANDIISSAAQAGDRAGTLETDRAAAQAKFEAALTAWEAAVRRHAG